MSEHICTAVNCPPFQRYYVSAIDGGRTYLMAGPYTTHAEALAKVDESLRIADSKDGRAWFMSWGTVRMPYEHDKPGVLNQRGLIS